MKVKTEFRNKQVEDIFSVYPQKIRERLLFIRELIFQVWENSKAIWDITETLKWWEPSYVCKTWSTLRIDKIRWKDDMYAIFFNCKTTLISSFKEFFWDEFVYSWNRAILFNVSDKINTENLKHCIYMSLTYKNR